MPKSCWGLNYITVRTNIFPRDPTRNRVFQLDILVIFHVEFHAVLLLHGTHSTQCLSPHDCSHPTLLLVRAIASYIVTNIRGALILVN